MGPRLTTLALWAIACAACSASEPPPASDATTGSERAAGPDVQRVDVVAEPEAPAAPGSEDGSPAQPAPPAAEPHGAVLLNGVVLTAPDLAELGAILGVEPEAGRFWYDAASGLWGLEGHAAGGVTRPGLRTAGPLAPDVSGGASGAFVNGRQLTATELAALATLLGWALPADARYAGRYTLDGEGSVYAAKGGYLGNLAAAGKRAAVQAGPNPARCVWYRLYEPDGPLGRDVTIDCD